MIKTTLPLGDKGASLLEILLVMGISAILMAFIGLAVTSPSQKQDLVLTVADVTASLNEARSRAMNSDTSYAGSAKRFGVRFETSRYIIFGGSTYSASDTTNFSIDLPSNFSFSTINLPNNQVVFELLNGEVVSYNSSQNSVTVNENNTNQTKTISINKLGTTNVQ